MKNIRILITFLLLGSYLYPIPPIEFKEIKNKHVQFSAEENLEKAENLFIERRFPEAIETYKEVLAKSTNDNPVILKKVAQSYSALHNAQQSVSYLEDYLKSDFNTRILDDSSFDTIRDTAEFEKITTKYSPYFSVWSFMYLYVALIGFYIAIVLQFNKKVDWIAKILISSFIFIHSFFIFHICLNITNYQYHFPHSYLMSTVFSFLYGPLLYFYFRRITQKYRFRKLDLLHLIPTALFIIYIFPTYSLSSDAKLELMLERAQSGLNPGDSPDVVILVILKLISLMVYGFFIRKLYLEAKHKNEFHNKANRIWQRNIYVIHVAYIFCYAGYGILISNHIISGFLYHSQVICMALMVMYIGYCASVQPRVFSGSLTFDKIFFKYEKSGLTESLSKELMENLIRLFDEEKIYKENDINLEKLADRLNTTRHNASQVINEHFKMNFHELVNKYRINEAKQIFETDSHWNLNIIDVAYEVGYNNKVTFNKAFKKDTQVTPSEYQRMALEV
ncbi:AraC family transcriptional regulator [Maribacter aestuarii]|uniref:AraC family transcriptional regulator n=1 Tax=Maribacter aestuarii TaxID=1130723 RepID=UPI00248BA256|nr:AraC family transcriptional regulator [Maribacter aestuarii]